MFFDFLSHSDKRSAEDQERKLLLCVLLVFAAGCFFRWIYAAQVPYNISRHDLGEISDWQTVTKGHLGYIQYLYQFHRFPDVAEEYSQFYHPPLFHLCGAAVMKFILHFGGSVTEAFEWIQAMNMVFADIAVLFSILTVFRTVRASDSCLLLTVFFSFCPIWFILGTEINNDCLMTMFCTITVYLTVCWIQERSWRLIVLLALSFALGMLSKTSAVLLAPAVGLVFLYALWKDRKKPGTILLQIALFSIICVPLGLSWVLRSRILFGIPFNYVPAFDTDSGQYIGTVPLTARLGLPSVRQMTLCSIDWGHYTDYANIWGQTFLTMSFDEGIVPVTTLSRQAAGMVLLWADAVLYLLGMAELVRMVFRKSVRAEYKLLLFTGFFTLMAGYVSFAFRYPQVCTMNFRYIVLTWLLLLTAHGMNQDCRTGKRRLVLRKLFSLLIGIVSVFSTGLYLLIH